MRVPQTLDQEEERRKLSMYNFFFYLMYTLLFIKLQVDFFSVPDYTFNHTPKPY